MEITYLRRDTFKLKTRFKALVRNAPLIYLTVLSGNFRSPWGREHALVFDRQEFTGIDHQAFLCQQLLS